MTSKDFIGACVRGETKQPKDGRKYNSSILWDGTTIYSYGVHYPLLFKVGNVWILNDRGYSNTTGKHISWAGSFADYRVHLSARVHGTPTAADVLESISEEIINLRQNIGATLEKEIQRPIYTHTYQKNIARYEERIAQLNALATVCTK